MQVQNTSNIAVSNSDKLKVLVGASRLVQYDLGCAMLGCTQSGMKRFIAEKRVPAGLVVFVGRDKKLNLEVLQKIVRGELRILSAAEAHALGNFNCRGVRADYERRQRKVGAKAVRAQVESQLNQAK
jgi:hypothetical protein